MPIKHVLAFLGAAAVSSMVLAQPGAPVAVSADGNTVFVQGSATSVVHLSPGQAEDVKGSFKLEDGRVLRLSSRNTKVFMEVDGRREELLPLSPTEFVASKSGARVTLDERAYGDEIRLSQIRR
jgi:hypothetical protein